MLTITGEDPYNSRRIASPHQKRRTSARKCAISAASRSFATNVLRFWRQGWRAKGTVRSRDDEQFLGVASRVAGAGRARFARRMYCHSRTSAAAGIRTHAEADSRTGNDRLWPGVPGIGVDFRRPAGGLGRRHWQWFDGRLSGGRTIRILLDGESVSGCNDPGDDLGHAARRCCAL